MKAKLAVRNSWTPETSPVQEAIQSLQDLLGRPVTCDPDWAVLHSTLGSPYPDAGQFVNDVIGLVQAWCRAAVEVFEDGDSGEDLCNRMLEAMEGSHRDVRLMVEVAAASVGQQQESNAATSWDHSRAAFVLYLPTKQPPQHPASSAIPLFRSQIMSAFSKDAAAPESSDRDDWAEVSVPSHPAIASPQSTPTAAAAPGTQAAAVEYLPDANTLMRPDELLLRPPYHLHIHFTFREIRIQCSHSPSLGFLEAYFKKWCRTNNRRTDKVFDAKPHDSNNLLILFGKKDAANIVSPPSSMSPSTKVHSALALFTTF